MDSAFPPQKGDGDKSASAGSSPIPPKSSYIFGENLKDFTTKIKIPPHSLKFDENYFLKLLAGSISLTKEEKKRIINSIPKLKQNQIDELIRIFEEEQKKFRALDKKHHTHLKKLEEQHSREWEDLEMSVEQDSRKKEDNEKINNIKKDLGL